MFGRKGGILKGCVSFMGRVKWFLSCFSHLPFLQIPLKWRESKRSFGRDFASTSSTSNKTHPKGNVYNVLNITTNKISKIRKIYMSKLKKQGPKMKTED